MDYIGSEINARKAGVGKKPKFIPGNPPNLLSPGSGCRFFDRCPEAMDKCKKTPPKIKTDSGYVLCWLYE